MFKEYFKIAIQNLSRRKLRSWLTLLGIIIGIATVVSLISLGQGMQEAVTGEFQKMGSDILFIQMKTKMNSMGSGTSNNPLNIQDAEFIKNINGVKNIAYYTLGSAKIKYQGTTKYYFVWGVPTKPEELKLMNSFYTPYGVYEGRLLEPNDKSNVVMGWSHANKNFWNGKNIHPGEKITINNHKFIVAGIAGATGSPEDDKSIIMNRRDYKTAIENTDRVDGIIVKANNEEEISQLNKEITKQLSRRRGLKPEDADFTVQTPEDIMESFKKILDVVQIVIIGIALISLFVGIIGIMNTMYTSIMQRNKEIGIMKAIGARNKDIFTIFLIESGMLGLVGGIIGMGIGLLIAKGVEFISTQAMGKSFLQASISLELIIGAIIISFIIGSLAGTLPAIKASKEKPADTLRDE